MLKTVDADMIEILDGVAYVNSEKVTIVDYNADLTVTIEK